jgi:putative FmdB family regulatory protein
MPTYEYECLECKSRFDLFQSINDDPVEKCVKCNGKVRKLFGTAGIIFKGSGFYVNDYRKSGGANGGSTESAGSSTGTGNAGAASPAQGGAE